MKIVVKNEEERQAVLDVSMHLHDARRVYELNPCLMKDSVVTYLSGLHRTPDLVQVVREPDRKWAVYEREPRHCAEPNTVVLASFDSSEEAETARGEYGYTDDNYYVGVKE